MESFNESCFQRFHMVSPDGEGCDLTNLIDVERTPRCGGAMKVGSVFFIFQSMVQ